MALLAHAKAKPRATAVPKYQTKHVVVKCALRKAMDCRVRECDGRVIDKYAAFSGEVEKYVHFISRGMHLASLDVAHHVTDCLERGVAFPDFYKVKDTFIKKLIRRESHLSTAEQAHLRLEVQPDGRVRVRIDAAMLPPIVAPDVPCLDQVVGYASTSLRTLITNNAWVPLWCRLERLFKCSLRPLPKPKADATTDLKPSPYSAVQAVRRAQLPDAFDTWHPDVRALVAEARERLWVPSAQGQEYLWDDHGQGRMTFEQVMRFNYWMQQRFDALGARRFKLVATCNVARKHVRLDTRVLRALLAGLDPGNAHIKVLAAMDKEHTVERKAGRPGYLHPDECMLPAPLEKLTKNGCTEQQWADYKAALELRQEAVAQIKATAKYTDQLERHTRYSAEESAFVASYFAGLPRGTAHGAFDCSVATDGVAVGLQFSKTVLAPEQKKGKRASSKKAGAASAFKDLQRVDAYDRHLDMFDPESGTLTLGCDPGRSNIASIAVVTQFAWDPVARKYVRTDKRARKTWRLSRQAYRAESGIAEEDRLKAQRMAPLAARWSALGKDSALRTCRAADIQAYVEKAQPLWPEWWELALKRRESRADLRRHMGKRSALDGFFARVRKEAEAAFPRARVTLAYGSAGVTMKPTGPGEVAVPTTEAYRASLRAFGPGGVTLTPEHRSTMIRWETGLPKCVVYKRRVITTEDEVTERLCHVQPGKRRAPAMDRHQVQLLELVDPTQASKLKKDSYGKTRYPEVRGLRFCTETRMYFDQDVEAAIAIGRLCIMRLNGQVPACYAPAGRPGSPADPGAKAAGTQTTTNAAEDRKHAGARGASCCRRGKPSVHTPVT